jgi:hypothetical protein
MQSAPEKDVSSRWRRGCIGARVTQTPAVERRLPGRTDRRRHSRSGRRKQDPNTKWRRVAWLFAFYAGYLSVRAVPAAIRRLWHRQDA